MWVVVDEVGVHLLSVQIHVDSCLQRHAQGLAKGAVGGMGDKTVLRRLARIH